MELAARLGAVGEGGSRAALEEVGRVGLACVKEAEECEAWAAEAPAEFLDPLLNCIMVDPVAVGGAGAGGRVYERSSIAQQILTDPRDPFTRAPLRFEDLVPLPQLQARIAAWLAERRGREEGTA